jgi:hypothetical protein
MYNNMLYDVYMDQSLLALSPLWWQSRKSYRTGPAVSDRHPNTRISAHLSQTLINSQTTWPNASKFVSQMHNPRLRTTRVLVLTNSNVYISKNGLKDGQRMETRFPESEICTATQTFLRGSNNMVVAARIFKI